MKTSTLSSDQTLEIMFSLTPEETKQAARRTSEIAHERGNLGAGIRGALEEIAAARREAA
jgi:hypothetical protein